MMMQMKMRVYQTTGRSDGSVTVRTLIRKSSASDCWNLGKVCCLGYFRTTYTELGCSLPYTSLELYAMIQASLQLRLVSVVSLAGRKLERAHEFVRMVG